MCLVIDLYALQTVLGKYLNVQKIHLVYLTY